MNYFQAGVDTALAMTEAIGPIKTNKDAALGRGNIVCDTVDPLDSFYPDRYMGTWYEIQHSMGQPFQPDSTSCTRAEYTDLDADAGTFKVYNNYQLGRLPPVGVHGTASCAGQPNGQCIVSFFGQKFDAPNYKIIDTDYDSYAMVYDCSENDMAYLWILSRTPTMDQTLFDSLNAQAAQKLPNYDFNNAAIDVQGDEGHCYYS